MSCLTCCLLVVGCSESEVLVCWSCSCGPYGECVQITTTAPLRGIDRCRSSDGSYSSSAQRDGAIALRRPPTSSPMSLRDALRRSGPNSVVEGMCHDGRPVSAESLGFACRIQTARAASLRARAAASNKQTNQRAWALRVSNILPVLTSLVPSISSLCSAHTLTPQSTHTPMAVTATPVRACS